MSTLAQFIAPVEADSALAGLGGEQSDLSELWSHTER